MAVDTGVTQAIALRRGHAAEGAGDKADTIDAGRRIAPAQPERHAQQSFGGIGKGIGRHRGSG